MIKYAASDPPRAQLSTEVTTPLCSGVIARMRAHRASEAQTLMCEFQLSQDWCVI